MTVPKIPVASDLLAIRRMMPVQAERFLRDKGYDEPDIIALRPSMGTKLESVGYKVVDNLRSLFMAVMFHKGVPYRQIGKLYGISHATAYNLVKHVDPHLAQAGRMKISMEELEAYQKAFYAHSDDLVPLDIPTLAQRLDEIAVEYIDK